VNQTIPLRARSDSPPAQPSTPLHADNRLEDLRFHSNVAGFMLTVSNVSKSHGGRVLFRDASLQVNTGDRIGLIGANGAGKSTLFSLILGESTPDEGTITLQRGVRVGFLPQEHAASGEETVLQLATSITDEIARIHATLREFPSEESHEHHDAWARYAELEGHALEAKAKRILSGLAFRETDFDKPLRTLSGGWIMRAHLARLLVMEPELLMLDEPTNHFDLESLGWFQNHLQNYSGAILAISHDRAFLNAICRQIVEISRSKLHRYTGNYDAYVLEKRAREEQHAAAYRNQQREIAHMQAFIDRFRAKNTKAAQAQERIRRLEKMERIEPPENPEATVRFRFPQPPRSGQRVAVLESVTQAYGDHVVYRNLNLTVERGQRIVLVGPNGAGKSTLLKLLGNVVPILEGTRTLGHQVSCGYFAQHRTEMLDGGRTVLAEAMSEARGVSELDARTLLGAFLFRGDDVFKPVAILSGGEKSRLALAKLLLNPPNLLLLDEPTTHLDMASIDALIEALKQYEGTMLFVSHDVHFIRAVARTVLHVQAGRLTPYAGDYDYYLEKTRASSERDALVSSLSNYRPEQAAPAENGGTGKQGLKEIREERRRAADEQKDQARIRREREREAARLESEILALEKRQQELTAALEQPETYNDPAEALKINRELTAVTESLERATEEWEKAAQALA
jgi:ATP-binding cassette subfamily F protein 3